MKLEKMLFIFAFLLIGIISVNAAEENRTASIIEVKGSVEVKIGESEWKPAVVGMTLQQGDLITTKEDSFALLNVDGMGETATVEVKPKSQLKLAELLQDKEKSTQRTMLDLALGEVLIKAKKLNSEESKFEVKTPTSVVGVRGTTFAVTVEAAE